MNTLRTCVSFLFFGIFIHFHLGFSLTGSPVNLLSFRSISLHLRRLENPHGIEQVTEWLCLPLIWIYSILPWKTGCIFQALLLNCKFRLSLWSSLLTCFFFLFKYELPLKQVFSPVRVQLILLDPVLWVELCTLKSCWNPNPQYLWMWLCLETRSL